MQKPKLRGAHSVNKAAHLGLVRNNASGNGYRVRPIQPDELTKAVNVIPPSLDRPPRKRRRLSSSDVEPINGERARAETARELAWETAPGRVQEAAGDEPDSEQSHHHQHD